MLKFLVFIICLLTISNYKGGRAFRHVGHSILIVIHSIRQALWNLCSQGAFIIAFFLNIILFMKGVVFILEIPSKFIVDSRCNGFMHITHSSYLYYQHIFKFQSIIIEYTINSIFVAFSKSISFGKVTK